MQPTAGDGAQTHSSSAAPAGMHDHGRTRGRDHERVNLAEREGEVESPNPHV